MTRFLSITVAWVFALGWAGGCGFDGPATRPEAYPASGLYTPGSLVGASDPTDFPMAGAGLGNRCKPLDGPDGGMGTEGTLTVEFETQSLGVRYAPRHCTAVWIERPDGAYVATIELFAALQKDGLAYWQDHACTEKTGPDVVTGATLRKHDKPHTAIWKGLDLDEKPVPDGTYLLFIEVSESDKEPSEFAQFEFEKGPQTSGGEMAVDSEGPLTRVSIVWEPGTE